MRKISVIGIGAGDPEQVTIQAVRALNEVDVFFLLDKGEAAEELVLLRREILDRYVGESTYRIVVAADPPRDRTASDYVGAVADWHQRRADVYERLIRDEVPEDGTGAVLAWGDPTLYDNTIAMLNTVLSRGDVEFDFEVIPGVSSVATLTARHRTSLNQIGRPVQITTGRRLARGFPDGVDDVVVMLDAHNAFAGLEESDVDIYWGAYLGTPDEILISGQVSEVAEEIRARRAQARARKGWIMDTYLLRRRTTE
ncbi:precorrin-6A synthase (deacetylating) [Actinophytocola oryzae]|uniref:Precorrin-6A synthase (Deacetylating) n=1 Tax=Actinophytocola oryzae TaxID=502181 RepID=A0A4R7VFL4_9PSEU|nr:precorrin-6A synthase (deacetylating) [Actinophytocola oryzae]TDV48036.1 precorrin-6A synthase (deacetylating) [Actinophytocola oryzae]